MATHHFSAVPVWGSVGRMVRFGARAGATISVTLPDGTDATVVQNGATQVGYLLVNSAGLVDDWTTTDIPSVVLRFDFGSVTVSSAEAATAGAANAAAAQAAQTAAESARDDAEDAAATAATVTSGKADGLVANPGLTAQPPARRRDREIDVVTEGNVPTDGTTAAQSALITGLALASGGRRAHIRKGTYKLTGRIDGIPQGTVIEGEPGTTILVSSSAMIQVQQSDLLWRNITFQTDTAGTERFLFSTTAGTTNYKNWRFEHCKFDGVKVQMIKYGAVTDLNTTVASWNALGSYVEFYRCEITNTKTDGGIWAAGVDDVHIDRCYFHDLGTSSSTGEATKASYGAKGFQVTGSLFVNGTRDAIDLYDCVGALVQGNEMRNMGVCAVEAKRLTTTTEQPIKHRIIGNRAINCQTSGTSAAFVFTLGTHYVHASGNTAEGGPGGGFRFGGAIDDVTNKQKGGNLIGNHALAVGGNGFAGNGTDGACIIGNYAESCSLIGFSFPTSVNTNRKGDATMNASISNGSADQWA